MTAEATRSSKQGAMRARGVERERGVGGLVLFI
jgi:hypothetical protein